jgi:hypothetical protein
MTTRLSADRLALPPPDLDLMGGERRVGWIAGDAVGFRGFADETEAAHAAWVSYRALARRLARSHGTRPVPIDTEPLALRRQGDEELILASGRPIATLVRPGPESRSGADSFGFEIRVPAPADELRVRAMGHLMYRTLRKSGLRWAMWRPAPAHLAAATVERPEPERVPVASPATSIPVTGGAADAHADVHEPLREPWWRRPVLQRRRPQRPSRGRTDRQVGTAQC